MKDTCIIQSDSEGGMPNGEMPWGGMPQIQYHTGENLGGEMPRGGMPHCVGLQADVFCNIAHTCTVNSNVYQHTYVHGCMFILTLSNVHAII